MAEGQSFWTWRTGGPSLAERGRGRPTLPRISMPPPDPSPALSRSYDDDSPQLRRRSQPNTPGADHDRRNSSSLSISSSDRPLPPVNTFLLFYSVFHTLRMYTNHTVYLYLFYA